MILGATVRLVESPPAVALAVLGYPDMPTRGRRRAGAAAAPAGGDRGDGRAPGRRRAPPPRRCGGAANCRAATGGCSSRPPARPRPRRAAAAEKVDRRRRRASTRRSSPAPTARRCGASARTAPVSAAARRPAQPAWPGWEDAAVPPDAARRLPARVPRADGRTRRRRAGLRPLRRRLRARPHRLPARRATRWRSASSSSTPPQLVGRHGGSMSGEHGDGRARGELLPYMYSPEAIATFAAVKRIFDPDDLLNPGVIVAPAPVDADLRVPPAQPMRPALGFAYAHDGGDLSHRGAPLRRRRQVPRRHHRRPAASCARPTWRPATRRTPPADGHGCCRSWPTARSSRASAPTRSPSRSTCACPARAARSTARPAWTWRPTRPRCCYQRYRRRLRPAAHYALGWLPRWARLAVASAAASRTRSLRRRSARARWPSGWAASTPAVRCRQFAAQTFRAAGSRARPPADGRAGAAVGRHLHRPLPPEVGRAAVAVLEAAGYAVRIADRAGVLRADLDLDRPARRRAPAAAPHARRAGAGVSEGMPIVGLEPSCTAVLRSDVRELLPDDPRAAAVAGRDPHAGRAARPTTPGWQPPRSRRRARGGPAALPPARGDGLDGRRRAAARRRREGHRGRRLLRAGRQLRRRAGPLRRVGRGRRDGAAAGRACRAARTRSCWPTASPAAPSSSSSATCAACHLAQLLADAPWTAAVAATERAVTGFVPPPYPYDRLDEIIAIAEPARRRRRRPVDRHAVRPAAGRGDRCAGRPRHRPRLPALDRHARIPRGRGRLDRRRLGAAVDPATEIAAVRRHARSSSRPSRSTCKLRDPSRDTVLYPAISYPTYEMGATLAGCRAGALRARSTTSRTTTPPARCASG